MKWLMTAKFWDQALSNDDIRCCQKTFDSSIVKCQVGSGTWWEANSSLENSIVDYCLILNTRSSLLLLLQVTGHPRTHLTILPLSTVLAKYSHKASCTQTIESVCERMEKQDLMAGVQIKELKIIKLMKAYHQQYTAHCFKQDLISHKFLCTWHFAKSFDLFLRNKIFLLVFHAAKRTKYSFMTLTLF